MIIYNTNFIMYQNSKKEKKNFVAKLINRNIQIISSRGNRTYVFCFPGSCTRKECYYSFSFRLITEGEHFGYNRHSFIKTQTVTEKHSMDSTSNPKYHIYIFYPFCSSFEILGIHRTCFN
jgi:hypothetical protein